MARFAILGLFIQILCACASAPAPLPEPITVEKEVERIVQVRCADKREPLADLPDDDGDLAAVSLDDPIAVFILAQKYVAARPLYRARLKADDAQIKACTGE